MSNRVPIYWGNHFWETDDTGALVQAEPLPESDSNWIDYGNAVGQSAQIADFDRQRRYRKILHDQIITELLADLGECLAERPLCLLTHGGIASGKTAAIDAFLSSSEKKFLRLDYDRIKRLIPEFIFMHGRRMKHAGEFTQTESARLAGRALKKAIRARANIVYEGSLADLGTIAERIEKMHSRGYVVAVISTYVPEEVGQARAIKRYEAGGRFVSPEKIADTYQKCPKSLVSLSKMVHAVFLINNERDPAQTMLFRNVDTIEIISKELYAQYLQVVGEENRLD